MKRIIGYLKDLTGQYYAKDPEGNLREIHPDDPIYEGEVVVDAAGHVVVDALRPAVESDATAAEQTETPTAEAPSEEEKQPEEKKIPETTDYHDFLENIETDWQLQAPIKHGDFWMNNTGFWRPGAQDEVNIDAPLRDNRFEDEFRHEYDPYAEMESGGPNPPVIIKLIALDQDGNPILDPQGHYAVANEGYEGEATQYMALAFQPGTTEFTPETRLSDQSGTVTILFRNDSAQGADHQSAQDGSQDFSNATQVNVPLGTPISTELFDDYMADDSEEFTVSIADGSYGTAGGGYGNVTIDPEPVTTTIHDNAATDGTPNDPNDPNDGAEPDSEPVVIKLIALDDNGEIIRDPATGDYQVANSVIEGETAHYMALAFRPGTTTFNDDSVLDAALQQGTVDISFHDGSAGGASSQSTNDGSQDFDNDPQVSVQLGSVIGTETFNDIVNDDGETYTVTIDADSYTRPSAGGGYEDVSIDTSPVTTTIYDGAVPTKVFVKLFHDDSAPEGGQLTHTVELVDENGDPVTVAAGETITVTIDYNGYGQDPATAGDDYAPVTTVQILAGTSSTTFTVNAVDDYYNEQDEQYIATISNVSQQNNTYEQLLPHTVANGASSDIVSAIGTITDNEPNDPNPDEGGYDTADTVYLEIVGPNSVAEGDTAQGYQVRLLDHDGNPVTVTQDMQVTVRYNNLTTQNDDTQYTDGDTITLTIPSGSFSVSFDVDTIDDYIADNGEQYRLTIDSVTQNEFENVDHDGYTDSQGTEHFDNVTTTIRDNSDPYTPGDHSDGPEKNAEPVIIKVFASDENGVPLKDSNDGHYLEANEAPEGGTTHYVALAFAPGTTTFSDATVLDSSLQQGTVDFTFTDATATRDTNTGAPEGSNDYLPQSNVTGIALGTAVSADALDDYMADNGETFTVTIGNYSAPNTPVYEDVSIDQGAVTTTITDDSGTNPNDPNSLDDETNDPTHAESNHEVVQIRLVACDSNGNPILVDDGNGNVNTYVFANEVPEDDAAYYMALAFKPGASEYTTDTVLEPVNQIGTVTITTADQDAHGVTSQSAIDGSQDYAATQSQEVSLGQAFSIDTLDDYRADNGEKYKVAIDADSYAPVSGSGYENVQVHTDPVTTTITDGASGDATPNQPVDTVYVKITHPDSVIEGNQLSHTVSLVDKDGNPVTLPSGKSVTVTLTYTSTDGVDTSADFSTLTTSVTITGGSSQTFVNVPLDDFTAEGTEHYTVSIASVSDDDGTFENLEIHATDKSTTGEIIDGVTPGTPENSYVDEDNFDPLDPTSTLTDTDSLGITAPAGDNGYTLSFTGAPTFTSDDASYTTLTSDGVAIEYEVNGDTITAYKGSGRMDDDRVFVITLDKNAPGGSDDSHTYTQFKNIDHPTVDSDDDVVLDFAFEISDQGETSDPVHFTVTVNDSLPQSSDQALSLAEDYTQTIIISNESFSSGEITLNNGVDGDQSVSSGSSIDIYDTGLNDVVGKLTNNGDGTLTFTPHHDYSGSTHGFDYSVSDTDGDTASAHVDLTVTPVADAPSVAVSDLSTTEDKDNQTEGNNKVSLNLSKPSLSSDQTDQNGTDAGDHPERLGYIELQFDNGAAVAGAKLIDTNGTVLATIGADGDTVKFYLNDVSDYHISGLDPSADGAISLSESEFNALQLIPAEDNDIDVQMTLSVTSYETDDSGVPLDPNSSVLTESASDSFTLAIEARTDDVALKWDDNSEGTISTNVHQDDTYTFNTRSEGDGAIDLTALLSAVSGAQKGPGGAHGDLDGSEHRSYTISGIPNGTVVTLGGVSAVAAGGSDDNTADASVTIAFPDNTDDDPSFTLQLPEQFGGTIDNGVITLSVADHDSDTSYVDTTKIAKVYFTVDVTPVVDDCTLQVAQPIGEEDAGRTQGNISNDANAADIDAPQNGIDLGIVASSDDTDGSETYDITVDQVPDGASLYYDGVLIDKNTASGSGLDITDNGDGTWKLKITDFDNDAVFKIIPPHNSDEDFTLHVEGVSVEHYSDGSVAATQLSPTALDINVQVKGVADIPVHDDLANVDLSDDNGTDHSFNATGTEDSGPYDLKGILATPDLLDSYDSDGSEKLTIKLTGLDTAFDIQGATLVGGTGAGRIWFIDLADLKNGDVKLVTPQNYAGEVDFDIAMITTEREGDSKTHPTKPVQVMITPEVDNTINTHDTQDEDEYHQLDFSMITPDADGSAAGAEELQTLQIKVDSLPAGVALYDANHQQLTDTDGDGYIDVAVQNGTPQPVFVQLPEDSNMNGQYSFKISYTVQDTALDGAGDPYSATQSHTDIDYTVDVHAVTDDIDMTTETTATGIFTTASGDAADVNVDTSAGSTGTFTKKIAIHGIDSDGRGHPDEDGSEKFTRIEVHGVPEGITIENGHYAGDTGGSNYSGLWYVDVGDIALDGNASYDLVFKFENGTLVSGDYDITITAFNEDSGNGQEQNDSETFTLHVPTDVDSGNPPPPPPTINAFYQDIDNDGVHDHDYTVSSSEDHNITDSDAYPGSILREDTPFALSDVIHVETDGTGSFGITIRDLTPGYTISGPGLSYDMVNQMYTLTGQGDQAAIVQALQNLTITPPENHNTDANDPDNTDLNFDIELTTYADAGDAQTALINFSAPILPVTDPMDLSTTGTGTTPEDTDYQFSVTMDNQGDGNRTEIIDGKVYLQLNENYTDFQGDDGTNGSLWYNGTQLTLTHVSGVSGIADGDYYVIENVQYGDTLDFVYKPAENRDGHVDMDLYVKNKESEAWNPYDTQEVVSHKTIGIDVTPVEDGFSNFAASASGDEDTRVVLTVNGEDPDDSEKLSSITLDRIPNGFIVYYGADAASATIAQNVGVNGQMTLQMHYGVDETVDYNLWNIPTNNGEIPAYIAIQPPENWSGTIPDVSLNILSEGGNAQSSTFNAEVNPVVDGLTIEPTKTFGGEGEEIPLRLNANVIDLDGSEVVDLTLTGLGEGASFKVAGSYFPAVYDASSDTYTLSGVPALDVNEITFIQSAVSATVTVTAHTVEQATSDTSSDVSATFELNIHPAAPSSGDDTFLYDGTDTFDGEGGVDTVVLKSGTDVDFSGTDTPFANIEAIDLRTGTHTLSNLAQEDVARMLDGTNTTLTIHADGDDTLNLTNQWTDAGNGDYTAGAYTIHVDGTADVTRSSTVIDGIVEGMYYETSSGLHGFTDADGTFDYADGDTVVFKIGEVELGRLDTTQIEDGKVFLQDIAGTDRTDLSDQYVENMAVLLQSLDNDGDAYNGIVITEAMHEAFSDDSFDLATISEEALVSIIETNGAQAVDNADAMEHVAEMLVEYSGVESTEVLHFDTQLPENVPMTDDLQAEFSPEATSEEIQDLFGAEVSVISPALHEILDLGDSSTDSLLPQSSQINDGDYSTAAEPVAPSTDYTPSDDPTVHLNVEDQSVHTAV